jgi:hypothetical protein
MRRLFLSSIIAFLAISLRLYAQDTAQAEPKVKLELVWEKEFEAVVGEYILNVDEKGEPFLYVVSLFSDTLYQVNFAKDKESKIINLRLNEKGGGILYSKDKNYIVTYEVTKRNQEEILEVSLALYNKNGILLWKNPVWLGKPSKLLSNGTILCSENPYGWGPFTLRNQNHIVARITPCNAFMATGSFEASKNSYFVFNVKDLDHSDKTYGELVLYNQSGAEIWRKKNRLGMGW